jgi:hypothetical protein
MIRDFTKLTDEEKLDLFVDLIDPVSRMMSSEAVAKAYDGGKGKIMDVFKAALKADRKATLEVLSIFSDAGEDYKLSLTDPILVFAEIMKNPELVSVFTFAGRMTGATSSGSHTENSEVKEN